MRCLVVLALATASAPVWAAPQPEDNAAARRAVRGSPVPVAHESAELRALREFEEETFSRDELPAGIAPEALAAATREGALPRGLGPDAIPEALRSPDPVQPRSTASTAIPWLAQLHLPDLPMRLDPRVVRYLEFYKSDKKGQSIISSWLRRQGRYHGIMLEALRRARLPLALEYVSMIESGFDPHDRSHAGAVGLWQLLPSGAKAYGLRVDYWVDERKDPERATEAALRYLGDLKHRFGSWPLALAAYNAGYGAVLKAMRKYNTNDYWELCRHENGLPWDTMLYVPKALAAAIVGANRSVFGFADLPGDPPFSFDRVTVPGSTSLASVARAIGVETAEVAALNPALRRGRTPPERWALRVPKGTAPRFAAAYQANRDQVVPRVVRFGERLEDLAESYGLTVRALRALNGVEDSAEVRPGLTLVVPDVRPRPAPAASPCDAVIVPVPNKELAIPGKRRIFYRTLPRDAIDDIAAFFKVSPTELARWNAIDLRAKLASNMVLQLWVAPDFDTSQAAVLDPAIVRVVQIGSEEFFELVETRRGRKRLSYSVKKGDDLKKIGRKFGLSAADMERINGFGERHRPLTVGQKLTVYRSMTAAEKAKLSCAVTPGGAEVAAKEAPIADPADDDSGDEPSDGDALAPSPEAREPEAQRPDPSPPRTTPSPDPPEGPSGDRLKQPEPGPRDAVAPMGLAPPRRSPPVDPPALPAPPPPDELP